MKDETTPATKADIQQLYDATERWKEEILTAMVQWKEQIVKEFRLVIESLRHDFLGVQHDKVELLNDRTRDHEKRIRQLEAHAGV